MSINYVVLIKANGDSKIYELSYVKTNQSTLINDGYKKIVSYDISSIGVPFDLNSSIVADLEDAISRGSGFAESVGFVVENMGEVDKFEGVTTNTVLSLFVQNMYRIDDSDVIDVIADSVLSTTRSALSTMGAIPSQEIYYNSLIESFDYEKLKERIIFYENYVPIAGKFLKTTMY